MALFRFINKEKARRLSVQSRGPRNRFEKYLLEELPRAALALEHLYGIKLKSLPFLLAEKGVLLPDQKTIQDFQLTEKKLGWLSQPLSKIYERELRRAGKSSFSKWKRRISFCASSGLNSLYFYFRSPASYDRLTSSIQITNANLFCSAGAINRAVIHELTHHALWEQKSKIYSRYGSFRWDFHAAKNCANEGLAVFAEERYFPYPPMETREKAIRALQFPFIMIKSAVKVFSVRPLLASARALAFAATDIAAAAACIMRCTIWRKPSSFSKALEKNNSLAFYAINPYRDGSRFIDAVCRELGSPKEAFRAVADNPPQSMEEILLPHTYLDRLGR
ncbi:hypothetical protein GF412_05240 [Candidatus Micrarchaeota archaeon]|nr:hypothetical protein [Candidatus Micrarchaeota archaeon]MBD3418358.1 hypothetical protein [Candidatus Micrarchaeota archaeon]